MWSATRTMGWWNGIWLTRRSRPTWPCAAWTTSSLSTMLGGIQSRSGDGPPSTAFTRRARSSSRAHAHEVDSMFDALTYEKGGSLLVYYP